MNVSIVIPYFNKWSLTHSCLMGIYNYVSYPDMEIVLVNDASTDPECRTGAAWWQKQAMKCPIKFVQNKENLGFGGSHNRGAKAAEGNILIFLSNDVIVKGDFVAPIVSILSHKKPNTIIGGRIVYWDSGWNGLMVDGRKMIIPYPEGWLIACKREVWDNIGGFDPRYGKFDYEDVDIGATALYLGYDLVDLNVPFLRHISGATIGQLYPDRMEITEKNRKVFEDKWTMKIAEKLKESKEHDTTAGITRT
jgi:GT2 family glycosyltransferase